MRKGAVPVVPEKTVVPPNPVAVVLFIENWPGGFVASPWMELAWNRSSRPETLKVTACWMVVGVVEPEAVTDWVLLTDLSTMIRVPPNRGRPSVTE